MKRSMKIRDVSELGSALTFAMMILVVASIAAALYLKEANRRMETLNSTTGRELMTEQVKAHLKLFQDGLASCLDGLMNDGAIPDPICPRSDIPVGITAAQFSQYLHNKTNTRFETPFTDIEFECVRNCNTDSSFQGFPKVFRIRAVKISANNTRVMLRQMLEYSRQTVNDFAQLVMAQSTPIVLAPGVYDGKMGLQWGSEDLQPDPGNPGGPGIPTPPPAPDELVVKFNNTADPIEFRDSVLLSNMSISNVGNYDAANPVGPRFMQGLIPDVPRTRIADVVANMEDLIHEPYAIGDIGSDDTGDITYDPDMPSFIPLIASGFEEFGSWNIGPSILSQSTSNTLHLQVGGNPNCINLVRTITFNCTGLCPEPTNIYPIPPAQRCLTDRAVVYVNGPVTVRAENSSANTAQTPHHPFTILSRGTLTLKNSLVRSPGVDSTAALMVMSGDILIPDNARHRTDASKSLLEFATQVPAPSGQTDLGFEVAASMIVPDGRIVYTPTVMALPNTQQAELGGIETLGTTVVKELSPVSKQWTEGGSTYRQGFSFKRFQYDRIGLQTAANQFPGATIQSQGFKLVVTNETWDEQPSIATATTLLHETP